MVAAGKYNNPAPCAVFYRAVNHHYPTAVSATGMRIVDGVGRQYLDMSGGAAVSCLGHANPDVVAATSEQLNKMEFAHTAFFTNAPQEELARRIAARYPETGARVYFASGGSEANETALKLAWQYWTAKGRPQKKIIVSREDSYHGNTFGTLSVSGNAGRRRASAAPLLDWPRIPPCYEYRGRHEAETAGEYGHRVAAELEAALATCGAENVAAFICEPIVGSSLGVVPAVEGYLQEVRSICDKNEILLILDEIMCGSGRTGTFFAHETDGVVADIVSLAKGIGGGYVPLAAVVVRESVCDQLQHSGFAHGHTYVGHPVACAAGVAVQDVLDRDQLLARTIDMGSQFKTLLQDAFGGHPNVGDIRGRGLFFGLELVSDRDTKAGFGGRGKLPDELRLAALECGLICYPGGIVVDGKMVPHIMLAPPMIAKVSHFEECIEKLDATIDIVIRSK